MLESGLIIRKDTFEFAHRYIYIFNTVDHIFVCWLQLCAIVGLIAYVILFGISLLVVCRRCLA